MPLAEPDLLCGVDEAGRGPLAGPVFAAAVILRPDRSIDGLADSKKLTARRREKLAIEIRACAHAWAVASASVEEIDALNILQASLLAMQRAIGQLGIRPTRVLVDGIHCPRVDCTIEAVVGGDATVREISAASILAKVERDAEMQRLHARYPMYNLDRHKGYPTQEHIAAIERHGVCAIHRRTFGPVRRVLSRSEGS